MCVRIRVVVHIQRSNTCLRSKKKKKVLRVDDCRVNQTHACLPIRMQLYTAHVTEHLLEHLLAHMLTHTQNVQGTDKSLMLSPGYTE